MRILLLLLVPVLLANACAPASQPSPTPGASPVPAIQTSATTTSPVAASPTPSSITVKVYFSRVVNNDVEFVPVERALLWTQAIGWAAIEELLKGPTPEEKARGLDTSIPEGARLRSLKIVDGVAYADFDEALQFQVRGSLRLMAIRKSITLTLLHFPTVQSVVNIHRGPHRGHSAAVVCASWLRE